MHAKVVLSEVKVPMHGPRFPDWAATYNCRPLKIPHGCYCCVASTLVHAGVKHTCRIRSTDSLNGANSSCNDCNTPSCWQSKHRNVSRVKNTTNVSVRREVSPQALRVMRVRGARLTKYDTNPFRKGYTGWHRLYAR